MAQPEPYNSRRNLHIIEPAARHTNTCILLHGRGSNGLEFAQELSESCLPNTPAFADRLPGWRLVFPSSQELWSETFQESIPAWFEAHSLTDVTEKQELQLGGIKDSVEYISNTIKQELELLNGETSKLFLFGISQGGAVGIWTLLCEAKTRSLGGFAATCTWLPLATNIQRLIKQETIGTDQGDSFTIDMMGSCLNPSSLSTPIFLSHGIDDAFVDVELGRQARDVLKTAAFNIRWDEYSGAELEGHWLKVPEQVDNIVDFFLSQVAQKNKA